MISFNKPNELNGKQLCDELEAAGVSVNRETSPMIKGDEPFLIWLDVAESDSTKVAEVVASHIGQPDPEPSVADKLASVGLNINDLKEALGL